MKGTPRDEAAAVLKLPKWAQSRIISLIRERDKAIARFAELGHVLEPLHEYPARGHISYGDWEREIEIPEGDKVAFHFGDGADFTVRFTDDNTGLYIMGSDTAVINMQASNTFELSLRRDRVREKLLEAKASKSARNILLRPSEFDSSYKKGVKA